MKQLHWYEFEQVKEVDSPALIIYSDRVVQNISLLKRIVKDASQLRPHVKTSKIREVVQLMMAQGITKFKCATIAEAEMLAACGARDVLLAYQPTEIKLQRFIALVKNFPRTNFACLVDNSASAHLFAQKAAEAKITLHVYLDLNVGMNRTGIVPGEAALALYDAIAAMPPLKLSGLHAYDGHIEDPEVEKRKKHCESCFSAVEHMRESLLRKGYEFPLLVAGGSPTFPFHAQRKQVEVSPGTFIFWDKGYTDHLPDMPFLFAVLVLTRVVSLPAENKVCIDLGHKSIASENDLQHRVYFLNAPNAKPVSHSEEHMVIDAGPDHGLAPGDLLYAVPYHVCPTVALYDHAVCVTGGKIDTTWEVIARNRKISF